MALPQTPNQSPPPEASTSPLQSFGGGAGGMQVASQVSPAAGLLKTVLGAAGQVLGERELNQAAQALGGVQGVMKLSQAVQNGSIASATGGVTGGAGAAAAVSAVLSILAQETGNQDLAMAAQALGMAGSATSTGLAVGSALTGAAPAAAGVAGGTAGTGLAITTAGLGTALGAGLAPVAAGLLASEIANLISPGSAPSLSDALGHRSITGDYNRFLPDLMMNQGHQNQALQTLAKALPLVQSKEELGQLMNSYRNFIGSTTELELPAATSPYDLNTIPGVGERTHGQDTTPIDWTTQEQRGQGIIDALYAQLPGNDLADASALSGEANMRLWEQFQDRSQTAPIWHPGAPGTPGESTGEGFTPDLPAISPGYYQAWSPEASSTGSIRYGQPGYNYEGSGFPMPGQNIGTPTPYWQAAQAPPPPQGRTVPGTEAYQPSTIDQTGGMRAGIGSPLTQQRSALAGASGGKVNSNITQGLAGQTGFVPARSA